MVAAVWQQIASESGLRRQYLNGLNICESLKYFERQVNMVFEIEHFTDPFISDYLRNPQLCNDDVFLLIVSVIVDARMTIGFYCSAGGRSFLCL